MAKVKKAFFCQHCGAQHTQWQGQCKGCKEWNTLVEELISKEPSKEWESTSTNQTALPVRMDAIDVSAVPRTSTGDDELDRVLGGGLVAGAVILLGGEPAEHGGSLHPRNKQPSPPQQARRSRLNF